MALQVAHAERHSDAVLGEWIARWPEHARASRETTRRERNVRGDGDIVRADVLGDPVICGVRARAYDDMAEQRTGAGAQSAIADEMHHEPMPRRHALDFAFHRAGIAVDIDFRHGPTMPRDVAVRDTVAACACRPTDRDAALRASPAAYPSRPAVHRPPSAAAG